MTRRGQQKKNSVRRADRSRDDTIADQQVHGEYRPPPRSECVERNFYLPLDDEDTVQVDVHVWSHEKRVVDFHLTAEVLALSGREWSFLPIARVDICHGHAHAHKLIPADTEEDPIHIMRIDSIEDVQGAYKQSSAQIVFIARTLQGDRGNHG